MSTDSTSVTPPAALVQPPDLDRTRPEDRIALDSWWRAGADQAIEVLARTGRPFTACDLRDEPFGLPEPRHSSHWGGALSAARARGLLEPLGYTASRTPSAHCRVLRVWRGVRPTPVAE